MSLFAFLGRSMALMATVSFMAMHASASAAETKTEVYATRGDRELTITLHYPQDWSADDARPSIIFFFGGGWNAGSTEQFVTQADYLASRGMVAARADYRVKSRDGVTPDECVRDARSAVRWMKKNASRLGIDPEKLVASGGSAGGHLAACMMIDSSVDAADDDLSISTTPAAMILFNPVLTFEPPPLKERLGDRQDLADKISPIAFLDKNTPPSLILFGSDDRLLALAKPYWEQAEQLGVRADRFIADGKGHGFFNRSPWQERTLIAADAFLVSLGLLEGQATLEAPDDKPAPARRRARNN
jgi:acetyl esterase